MPIFNNDRLYQVLPDKMYFCFNMGTCFACVQNCKRDVKDGLESPVKIEPRFGGPEYETIGMCGSNLGLSDFKEIAAINQLTPRDGAVPSIRSIHAALFSTPGPCSGLMNSFR